MSSLPFSLAYHAISAGFHQLIETAKLCRLQFLPTSLMPLGNGIFQRPEHSQNRSVHHDRFQSRDRDLQDNAYLQLLLLTTKSCMPPLQG